MSEKKYTYDEETRTLIINEGVKEINQIDFFLLNIEEIKSVVMPNSLEILGRNCFANFERLEDVEMSQNLIKIEGGAFKNCVNLMCIEIPSGVKIIEYDAFSNCLSLRNIILNEGLEEISFSAFENCKSLRYIKFPSTLKKICSEAFAGVNFGKEIVLPSSLESFNGKVFGSGEAGSILKLRIEKENPYFEVLDDIFVVTKQDKELIYCVDKNRDRIEIPQGVKTITEHCFEGASFSNLVLNEGLESIGLCAFRNCENLKEVILPDSVERVAIGVFEGSGIELLHIGKNAEKVTDAVISRGNKLKKISVSSENEIYMTDEEGTMLFTKDVLVCSLQGKVPNENIKEIEKNCFSSLDIDEIVLPDSVECIESKAFNNCKNLKKVVFGPNLNDCYGDSFFCCNAIDEIEIDKNNPHIFSFAGKGIFKQVKDGQRTYSALMMGTKHTIFPNDCEVILENAFAGNSCINKVICESSIRKLNEVDVNFKKENETTIYLPNRLRHIGIDAFRNCDNLEEVDLSNSNISEIESSAFRSCIKMKKVHLPENAKIGVMAFSFGFENKDKRIKEVVLPFSTTMDFGNDAILLTADEIDCKFILTGNGKEFEIQDRIRHYQGGKNLVTANDIYLIDDGELIKISQDFIDELNKPFNKLDRLPIQDLYKAYYWKSHAEQVPPYYIVQNLPPSEIAGFYNNRKSWANLVKKFKYENVTELISFFKICHALGVFAEKEKSELAKRYVESILLPSLTNDEFVELFEYFDSYNNPFNPKFALLFMKYFAERDKEGNFILEDSGKVKVKGKNFLTYLDNANGEEISVLVNLHNDFEKLIELYPNKQVSNRPQKQSNRAYVDEKDIVKAYAFMNYDDEVISIEKEKFKQSTASFLTDNNTRKYGENIFEGFVDMVSQNGATQEQFVKLCEAFRLGISNFENAKSEHKIACKSDDMTSTITYELLEKSDPLGAVLGVVTDCCQRIGDNGGSCVEYGMKEPNSSFVVFRYKNKIIGQAWVWYDRKTKQVTLDNIEAPKFMLDELEENEEIEKEMVHCLNRLSDAFKAKMGERVDKVTIGLNFNSMGKILSNNFEKIEKKKAFGLSDYENKISLGFGPNGENKAYSDATSNAGQVLIKDYAKEKKQEEMER